MDGFNNRYEEQGMNNPSFFDCLFRMSAEEAAKELIRKGINTAKDVKQSAKNTFQAIKDEEYLKLCIPVLTMADCLTWVKTQTMRYPQGKYFFVYVEENSSPRNEHDNYSVTIALLDANKKPIPVITARKGLFNFDTSPQKNGQDLVCLVVPTGNIDNKLIKSLNGTSSVLVQL